MKKGLFLSVFIMAFVSTGAKAATDIGKAITDALKAEAAAEAAKGKTPTAAPAATSTSTTTDKKKSGGGGSGNAKAADPATIQKLVSAEKKLEEISAQLADSERVTRGYLMGMFFGWCGGALVLLIAIFAIMKFLLLPAAIKPLEEKAFNLLQELNRRLP